MAEPRAAGPGVFRAFRFVPRAVRAMHVIDDLEAIGRLLGRRIGIEAADADGAPDAVAAEAEPSEPPPPPEPTPRQAARSLSVVEFLGLPDAQIDLARGSLLIAREDEPELDSRRCLERLDRMADSIRARVDAATPGADQIAVVNKLIFEDLGLTADRDDPREARRLEALHLHHVLERRRGHCLGLSLLYLALGHRLDLPLFGVALPRHFFVRYEDGDVVVNVETTRRGKQMSDHDYAERYSLKREHVDGGIYLGNLARREVLVEVLNNRGNFYWDAGRIDLAMRDLDRATKAGRNFARGYTGQGFIYLRRRDLPRAIGELRKALELDPDYAPAYIHLGEAYLRAGLLDRAATSFRRAIETSSRLALARTNLGRVRSKMGDPQGALREHLEAIRIDPKSVHAWNNAGAVLGHMGEHEAAVNHLRRALALAPDFLPARENLVHILRRGGYRARAALERRKVVARYRREIARTPQRAAPLLGLARFLLECGREQDFHEAAALAERAAALRPDDPEGLSTLAEAHYRGGNLPRAVRVAERILELGPERLLGNERVHRNTLVRYREAVRTVLGADGGDDGDDVSRSKRSSSSRARRRKRPEGEADGEKGGRG